MKMEIRNVDSQGRLSLPAEWRRDVLGDSSEVYVFLDGDSLVVRPKHEPDLAEHFDSIIVDVAPEAFEDYHRLKTELLRGA